MKTGMDRNTILGIPRRKKISNNTVIEIAGCSPLEILKLQNNPKKIADGEGIGFIYGKGQRKPELQKPYKRLENCGTRLMEYKEHFEIMVKGRNSYSKPDLEATFTRMKEYHMHNGQFRMLAYSLSLNYVFRTAPYGTWISMEPYRLLTCLRL